MENLSRSDVEVKLFCFRHCEPLISASLVPEAVCPIFDSENNCFLRLGLFVKPLRIITGTLAEWATSIFGILD